MRMPTHDARAVSLVRHCEEKPEILIIRGSVREEKSYKSEEDKYWYMVEQSTAGETDSLLRDNGENNAPEMALSISQK